MATGDICRIELLGGLKALQGDRVITRFTTQKVASLVAYLAYYRLQTHPRGVLIEILWPDGLPRAGRASLSQALSSLRRQLEPPGVRSGSIIVTTNATVGLNARAVTTDVAEFEESLGRAQHAPSDSERTQALQDAVGMYAGDLLPGFYEDWVQTEQRRLSALYFAAVGNLIGHLEKSGDRAMAIQYAERAISVDAMHEETHRRLMRLYSASGMPDSAVKQYEELKRVLEEQLGGEPSPATVKLAQEVERLRADAKPEESRPALSRKPKLPSENLPTGTVTFLLTDIENSTATWERAGSEFEAALADHHAILRDLFRKHNGMEIKEAGDSFVVAFSAPSQALRCAVAGQESLHSHEWAEVVGSLTARMALNTGEVEVRDGEYHGLVLHRASRILTAGHGGQILCAETTAALLRRDLEQGIRFRDLGMYRMRDIQAPERLFQVCYPEMPQENFPALSAETGYRSNLPLQFTRFFGREAQMAQLEEMLRPLALSNAPERQAARLITLTGPGGTGKTRLALEVGERLLEPFAGAIWFVPLVDLTDARLIGGAILDAMRIQPSATIDPVDQAADALSRQPSLLILDNLEQFVEEAGKVVHTLMERAPGLTLFVTSRQSLGLSGEREFALAPLAVPNGPDTPERLTMYESVRLFVDRAQAVRPDFQVTNRNAPAVAELCDRLEGIPLAIELAAALALTLTPGQMLQQLQHRFDFLVSRRRDAAPRHSTLRAAINWSYDLLPPGIQRFFAGLSVFRGGWTVEAAEAVCEEPLALDYMAQLRDCSLILSEEDSKGMRFRMLVTLREYAEERLSPGERAGTQRRHQQFFLKFAEEGDSHLAGAEQAVWLDRLETEHENLRAALEFSVKQGEEELRLSGAMGRFWAVHGHFSEGRRWLDIALSRLDVEGPTRVRARALHAAGRLARMQGDYASARALHEESLSVCETLPYDLGIATVRLSLGVVAENEGRIEDARVHYQGSLAVFRELADMRSVALCLNNLGNLAAEEEDYSGARALYEEGIALAREIGDLETIALVVGDMGLTELCENHLDTARACFEESLAIRRAIGSPAGIAGSLNNLGIIAMKTGDLDATRQLNNEALQVQHEIGDKSGMIFSLEAFASLAVEDQMFSRAARLAGAASAQRTMLGMPAPAYYRQMVARANAAARAALGDDAFSAALAEGEALTLKQSVEYALQESA